MNSLRLLFSLTIVATFAQLGSHAAHAQTTGPRGAPDAAPVPAPSGEESQTAPQPVGVMPAEAAIDNSRIGRPAPVSDDPPPPLPNATLIGPRPSPTATPVPSVSSAAAAEPVDPGTLPTGRANMSVAATVLGDVSSTIRATPFASREQVVRDVQSRLQASAAALAELRTTVTEMSPENRKIFATAADSVKLAASALRRSLRTAQSAGQEQWEAARAQLATDYEAYGTALAGLDATTNGTAR